MNRDGLHEVLIHIRHRIDELQGYMDDKGDSPVLLAAVTSLQPAPDRELELKIAEKDRLELIQLQSNLRWLESENGGCCEQCGRDIPIKRLLVVPVTRLCVNCAR